MSFLVCVTDNTVRPVASSEHTKAVVSQQYKFKVSSLTLVLFIQYEYIVFFCYNASHMTILLFYCAHNYSITVM